MPNGDVAPDARNVRVPARMGSGRVAIELLGIWDPISASGSRSKGKPSYQFIEAGAEVTRLDRRL